jgi:hypothetical protein
MKSDRIKQMIRENAAEIVRLNDRRKKALLSRDLSPEKWCEWYQASEALSAGFHALAFPGGFVGAYDRIASGAPLAMEAAICFLEIRPFFYRSGYMYRDIFRRCKHAPLSPEQAARFELVKERLAEWKRRKRSQ